MFIVRNIIVLQCTRYETFYTGNSSIVRAKSSAWCVEIAKWKVIYIFNNPS
ncbi:MAG: hypothetical protein ACD_3C00110G0004 [uncultured bacterium (gcode 4)]|uniref:Uncharacterized protein n=1 Tax=uncultured bacterium (gcode 4) TaxID=1234023 RepID=K2FA56_9BACT|nr:MAG: hypothetical protein ACD_3C00110G0004 [uncultured bacterium (gcode 4)]